MENMMIFLFRIFVWSLFVGCLCGATLSILEQTGMINVTINKKAVDTTDNFLGEAQENTDRMFNKIRKNLKDN
jgi:hypothetical protein